MKGTKVRLITPVTSAMSRGEQVNFHERPLRRFGRLMNKLAPGTLPEQVTIAIIDGRRRSYRVKPLSGWPQSRHNPSAEATRFYGTSSVLPEQLEEDRRIAAATADSGFTPEQHLDAARAYLAEGDLATAKNYVAAGYVSPRALRSGTDEIAPLNGSEQ